MGSSCGAGERRRRSAGRSVADERRARRDAGAQRRVGRHGRRDRAPTRRTSRGSRGASSAGRGSTAPTTRSRSVAATTGKRPPRCRSVWPPASGSISCKQPLPPGAARTAKESKLPLPRQQLRVGHLGGRDQAVGPGRVRLLAPALVLPERVRERPLRNHRGACPYRPDPHIGFSAVARDFNEPQPFAPAQRRPPEHPAAAGARRTVHAGHGAPADRSWRNVDLGFELQYYQGSNPLGAARHAGARLALRGARVRERRGGEPAQRPLPGGAGHLRGLEIHFGGLGAGGGPLRQRSGGHGRRIRHGVDRRLHLARPPLPPTMRSGSASRARRRRADTSRSSASSGAWPRRATSTR